MGIITKQELAKLNTVIRAHRGWGVPKSHKGALRYLALGLCGECGELANLIKKDWRGDKGDRRKAIEDEVADVANYIFMIANRLRIKLPTTMLRKLREVEKRPAWKRYVAKQKAKRGRK